MKTPNITNLHTPSGEPITPTWFDLDNYDLEPDWSREEGGKMRTYHPEEEHDLTPLDFT